MLATTSIDQRDTHRLIPARFADGGALFAERVVVCDSSRIDTLLALPL